MAVFYTILTIVGVTILSNSKPASAGFERKGITLELLYNKLAFNAMSKKFGDYLQSEIFRSVSYGDITVELNRFCKKEKEGECIERAHIFRANQEMYLNYIDAAILKKINNLDDVRHSLIRIDDGFEFVFQNKTCLRKVYGQGTDITGTAVVKSRQNVDCEEWEEYGTEVDYSDAVTKVQTINEEVRVDTSGWFRRATFMKNIEEGRNIIKQIDFQRKSQSMSGGLSVPGLQAVRKQLADKKTGVSESTKSHDRNGDVNSHEGGENVKPEGGKEIEDLHKSNNKDEGHNQRDGNENQHRGIGGNDHHDIGNDRSHGGNKEDNTPSGNGSHDRHDGDGENQHQGSGVDDGHDVGNERSHDGNKEDRAHGGTEVHDHNEGDGDDEHHGDEVDEQHHSGQEE